MKSRRRGRPPKIPSLKLVQDSCGHLHDLEWLQECILTSFPIMQQGALQYQFMAEGQALRATLIESASQVAVEIAQIPGMGNVNVFLKGYFSEGKRVSEIAKEVGVTREWCSRSYRTKAFRLASIQFIRAVSLDSKGKPGI